ncbi:MAG: bifunctional phosphoribosylaminoimidazolecarboxamide formyltransferase/inosine monophosphate cyclohydrolase [Hyphomicrobium sp.]|nr:MAG: bifunctional phosphoribosylaminoimidazolecarboxamide formyltransferase/inosine monophosphate cyclohydrolase [Hyphomicrobium sp.]
MPSLKIRRALLSVSDKTGLVEFARALKSHGVALVSTGGTAQALKSAGLAVTDVAELTGFPEMMDGRVKTLHPRVHGGLLAIRENAEHDASAAQHAIEPIDLLVVNLYPFEETVAKGSAADACIENIDVGGPAMIRGAAKNHDSVTVIVEAEDYARVLAEMSEHDGATTLDLRRQLAAKAYARTAAYDAAISNWFAQTYSSATPTWRAFGGRLGQALRYGENPHQSAALYVTDCSRFGVATAKQVQGKELSYNNINDTDAAFELVSEFDTSIPAVAIIKHANPCGVATGSSLADAYVKALACDSTSAFGGIIAFNQAIDAATAEEVTKIFTEVVIAPDASPDAQAIFAAKKNLRLVLTGGLANASDVGLSVRSVTGGLLVQSRDNGRVEELNLKVVTKRQPTRQERADMLFAFKVAKHVKSNAIVYAKGGATVGIGAGQMSRIDSARIAAWKAQEAAKAQGLAKPLTIGSVVASDAFFPFADGLLTAAEAGVTAVIQPGGSMRDDEVIAAANAKGLAMVFTGMRHFRH